MSILTSANGCIASDSRRIASKPKAGKLTFKDDAVRMTVPSTPVSFLGSTVVGIAHTGLGKLASRLVHLITNPPSQDKQGWREQLRDVLSDDPGKAKMAMTDYLRTQMDEYCKAAKIVSGTAYLLVLTESTTWALRFHVGIRNTHRRLMLDDTNDQPMALGQNDRVAIHYMKDHELDPVQAIDAVAVLENGKKESPIGGSIRMVDRKSPNELRVLNMDPTTSSKERLIDALQRGLPDYQNAVHGPHTRPQDNTSAPKAKPSKPKAGKKGKKPKGPSEKSAISNATLKESFALKEVEGGKVTEVGVGPMGDVEVSIERKPAKHFVTGLAHTPIEAGELTYTSVRGHESGLTTEGPHVSIIEERPEDPVSRSGYLKVDEASLTSTESSEGDVTVSTDSKEEKTA